MEKARVLIVEDERILAMHLESCLQSFGHTVTGIVSTGEDAITMVEETSPDLVFMDIRLQGDMNGIQAADQIHSLYKLPVIFMTAYSDEETLENAKVSDPSGYVLKPFEKRELQVVIEMALYKHQAEMFMQRAYEDLEKRVEERTRELDFMQKQNEMILDSAGDGIFGVDSHGKFIFINHQAGLLMNLERKAFIGKSAGVFLRDIWPLSNDGKSHSSSQLETQFYRRDGTPISVEYTITPIEERDFHKSQGYVVIFRDISPRKKSQKDLHNLARHLKMSNEELEECLRAVFLNSQGPLKTIINYGHILDDGYGDQIEGEGQEFLHSIIEDGKRLKELISSLVVFCHMDRPNWTKYKMEEVNLPSLIEHWYRHSSPGGNPGPSDISFQGPPTVFGNRFLLSILFQNLLDHIKERERTGPHHLSLTSMVDEQEHSYRICIECKGGSGEGAEDAESSLLGPALCSRIVEYHGGRIWLEPGLSEGFRILLTLPFPQNSPNLQTRHPERSK